MKKYLSLFLLLTVSFGQDILIMDSGKEYRGELVEKTGSIIRFKSEGASNTQIFQIKKIKSLTLENGETAVVDGELIGFNSWFKESVTLSSIGGTLIGLSGVILYTNNQRTIGDDMTMDEIQDFADKTKSNTDLSYIMLLIGGLLIAFDNTELPND